MATAAQIALAAKRAADPSYQRAAANAAKAGDNVSLSRLASQGVTSSTIKAAISGGSITAAVVKQLGGSSNMATAGQSLYGQADQMLGGWLPGGPTSPSAAQQSVALKAAGATGAIAAAYGAYTLADQYLFQGKLPLGAKNVSKSGKRIRRYDYFNMRALRRADKRIDGFIKHSKKFISSTGYKLVRR